MNHLLLKLNILTFKVINRPRIINVKVVLITIGLKKIALLATFCLLIRIEMVSFLLRLFNNNILQIVINQALMLLCIFAFAPPFAILKCFNVIIVSFIHLDVALQRRVSNNFLAR